MRPIWLVLDILSHLRCCNPCEATPPVCCRDWSLHLRPSGSTLARTDWLPAWIQPYSCSYRTQSNSQVPNDPYPP
ncbi:hypothetical protein F5B17DRAFT_393703 [Nemania serpens]|nr:hypothetical protein F5B17DRAFT_393703 [Nemania serpens]